MGDQNANAIHLSQSLDVADMLLRGLDVQIHLCCKFGLATEDPRIMAAVSGEIDPSTICRCTCEDVQMAWDMTRRIDDVE